MFLGGKKIIISPNLFKSKGRNINLKKKKFKLIWCIVINKWKSYVKGWSR